MSYFQKTLNNQSQVNADTIKTTQIITQKILQDATDTQNNTYIGNGFITRKGQYNSAIGKSALNSTDDSTQSNFAAGQRALYSCRGRFNIGIGDSTQYSTISGYHNISLGSDTLYNNLNGSGNVAFGGFSLSYNNSSNNTAIGYYSGFSEANGTYNTYLGCLADSDGFGTYTYSTAVGSGAKITGNNQIVLGRANENVIVKGKISIGTGIVPNYMVDISGSFKTQSAVIFGKSNTSRLVIGPAQSLTNNDYCSVVESVSNTGSDYRSTMNFYTHGTASNASLPTFAMTINSSQQVGIGTASPAYKLDVNGSTRTSTLHFNNPPMFSANTSTTALDSPVYTTVVFTNTEYNIGGAWNGTTFTVPTGYAGYYEFKCCVYVNLTTNVFITLFKNGTLYKQLCGTCPDSTKGVFFISGSYIALLAAGDAITFSVYLNSSSFTLIGNPAYDWFQGTYLHS